MGRARIAKEFSSVRHRTQASVFGWDRFKRHVHRLLYSLVRIGSRLSQSDEAHGYPRSGGDPN